MLTEKNFAAALQVMGFTEKSSGIYEKIFEETNAVMRADLNDKKLFFPAQIKGRDRNNTFNESLRENLVVFECVHRLLAKGYRPEHIELEKTWKLGHEEKSGRADIIVYNPDGFTLFIVECKTYGDEYKKEFERMKRDGGQLFSYWQQEQNSKWLILYASTFKDNKIEYATDSVSCNYEDYKNVGNVPARFKIWREIYEQEFCGDVIFREDTVAYEIGVRPLRKRDLKDLAESYGIVNAFEEALRHNSVTNKQNAFDCLINLFICKLVDEIQKFDNQLMDFVYKRGTDTYEDFQDRLQRLFRDGMQQFMGEKIFYIQKHYVEDIVSQFYGKNRGNMIAEFNKTFRSMKFFNNNNFAFIAVYNEELFYKNSKVLREVVQNFQNYKIIGSSDLQTLGDFFEQLLDKGFKQDEGQFFTPIPITKFIWDALPLDEIIFGGEYPNIPKIIDYACGAGHFLTQGFDAVNKCFERHNSTPPAYWEGDKIFGVEKTDRLSRVSKVSLFMYGADKGNIKFGDGLENYSDEGIAPNSFDILVANPPYAIKDFKMHLQLKNNFNTLEKVGNGSEIETLFTERIAQLLKPEGIAAVILPSSILNKTNASFVAARESLLQNFHIRAIVQLKGKTFGATSTNTVILFLQRFREPPRRFNLVADSVNAIMENYLPDDWEDKFIFYDYTKRIGVDAQVYLTFVARTKDYTDWRTDSYFGVYVAKFKPKDKDSLELKNRKFYEMALSVEREKIRYFAMTYRQTTLIISAPTDNAAQEKFLGYSWSNRKGDEGIKDDKTGGYLCDYKDRAATNTLAAVIRKAFCGEKFSVPKLQDFYYYLTTSDMLDLNGADFYKTLKTTPPRNVTVKDGMKLFKLGSADFEVIIGNRVLSTEIVEGGKIPVYSANVFEEFGRIDKQNLTDFSKPSIIWGIDGDWMVNFIPANQPFYPTDHCGVLRVNTNEIIPEYLAFVLRVEGEHEQFSRSNRASIQRIKSLTVQIPPVEIQRQIVEEFRAVDGEISAQDKIIAACDTDVKEKFVEMFLRKNYPRDKLGKYIVQIRGVSYKPKDLRENLNDNSVLLLRANNIRDGKINHDDVQFVSKEKVADEQFIRDKDILMSASSGSLEHVGKTALCREDIVGETFGAFCKVIRVVGKLPPEYIAAYFSTKEYREIIMRSASGSNINNLKNEHIDELKIPMPPKEMQEEFAAYVEGVEARKASAQIRKEDLKAAREALVEKYFH